MNPPPQPSAATSGLAGTLRESCVQFTAAAEESFFFRQLYLLIASLFARLGDVFQLWQSGQLPPPPLRARRAANRARPHRHAARHRASTRRKSVRAPACPSRVRRAARHQAGTHAKLSPSAPKRRIDRYPKP